MRAGSRYRWVLIALLFVLSTVAYVDRVNMSIAGKMLAHDYGLSNVQLGWILSAFTLGYAVFQAPAGRAADLLGPRKTLALAAVWWAVFSSLSAAVPAMTGALAVLIVVRFTLGAGEAAMYPASNRIVAAWIPTRERGLATGAIFTGVGIGTALASPLVAYVMLRFGWRASFPLCGLLGLVAGLAWFLAARDTPELSDRVSASEREAIRSGIPVSISSPPLAWREIVGDRNVLLLTLSYFCYGYQAYIFFTWFFTYLTTVRGMDLRSSAWYAMLPGLGMAIGSALGGVISDRLTQRYGRRVGRAGFASAALVVAASFIALGMVTDSPRLASVILAGGAGTLYLAQSSFWSVSADIARSSAGAVSGVMNMGAQIGGVVTATLTPWIGEHFGWSTSFLVAAALCVVGAGAWLAVRPDREINAAALGASAGTVPIASAI